MALEKKLNKTFSGSSAKHCFCFHTWEKIPVEINVAKVGQTEADD